MTGAAKNPLATEGQRLIEDRALALIGRPEMQRARAIVTLLWQNVAGWAEADQADRFANMIDEYLFHHAFRAANGDANFPEVARFMVPQHHWFGRQVPGSRWAGDSPDFIYRTIPIAHGGHFEVRAAPTAARPHSVNWSLMADNTAAPVTLALLDSLDMDIAADGSFTLTIDPGPADGRANHIQTRPGADFVMIRDALGDWLGEGPNRLSVVRLDPVDPARSEDEMARHAAKIAIDGVYYTYYCTRSANGQPPNVVRPPQSSAAFGGMATQWGTKANLVLEDDEALIVRSNAAGATFRNVTLTDAFHMTIDYATRTSSLNMAQMAADADGNFTFVVAHHDPKLHNWLDTGGLRRTIFGERWQAFARGSAQEDPWLETKLIKFASLDGELGKGVRRVTSDERSAQIAARSTGYARRFAED